MIKDYGEKMKSDFAKGDTNSVERKAKSITEYCKHFEIPELIDTMIEEIEAKFNKLEEVIRKELQEKTFDISKDVNQESKTLSLILNAFKPNHSSVLKLHSLKAEADRHFQSYLNDITSNSK
jgi:hypothetical protein